MRCFLYKKLVDDVGEKSDLTCSLDGLSHLTLMHCACTGGTAGKDFAALRQIMLESISVLVVNKSCLLLAELANFSALAVLGVVLIESQSCILL